MITCFSSPRRILNLIQPNRKQANGFILKTGQPRRPLILSKVLHNFHSNIPLILHRNTQAFHHVATIFVLVFLVTPPVNWAPFVNKMPDRICNYMVAANHTIVNGSRDLPLGDVLVFEGVTDRIHHVATFTIPTPGLRQSCKFCVEVCLVFTALLTSRNLLQAVVDHVLHSPVGGKQPLPRPP